MQQTTRVTGIQCAGGLPEFQLAGGLSFPLPEIGAARGPGHLPSGRRTRVTLAVTLLAGTLYAMGANAACNSVGVHATTRLSQAAAVPWHSNQALSPASVATQPNTTDGEHSHREGSIVGFWHTYFLSGGEVFDEGFDQFTSDGLEILNDTAPPQPANGAGTICLGVFKKTGDRTFKLRHPFWSFDANGILVGTGLILEQILLDGDGDSYSGSFSFLTYDLNGALTFETTGDLRAQRITAN